MTHIINYSSGSPSSFPCPSSSLPSFCCSSSSPSPCPSPSSPFSSFFSWLASCSNFCFSSSSFFLFSSSSFSNLSFSSSSFFILSSSSLCFLSSSSFSFLVCFSPGTASLSSCVISSLFTNLISNPSNCINTSILGFAPLSSKYGFPSILILFNEGNFNFENSTFFFY